MKSWEWPGKKFNRDFQADGLTTCSLIGPGKVFEMLDYKVLQLGPATAHPKTPRTSGVEGEYMAADEYDLFTLTQRLLYALLPARAFGALGHGKCCQPSPISGNCLSSG